MNGTYFYDPAEGDADTLKVIYLNKHLTGAIRQDKMRERVHRHARARPTRGVCQL